MIKDIYSILLDFLKMPDQDQRIERIISPGLTDHLIYSMDQDEETISTAVEIIQRLSNGSEAAVARLYSKKLIEAIIENLFVCYPDIRQGYRQILANFFERSKTAYPILLKIRLIKNLLNQAQGSEYYKGSIKAIYCLGLFVRHGPPECVNELIDHFKIIEALMCVLKQKSKFLYWSRFVVMVEGTRVVRPFLKRGNRLIVLHSLNCLRELLQFGEKHKEAHQPDPIPRLIRESSYFWAFENLTKIRGRKIRETATGILKKCYDSIANP